MNTTIVVIVTVLILTLLAIIIITKMASKENEDIEDDEDDEDLETMKCPSCRGTGGHYINSNDEDDAEYIICEECNGDGEIQDRRTREQKLDDWQNDANQWIACKNCDADGYIYTENDKMIACPICNGYGVVKDTRTQEEKEADKIAAETIELQRKLEHLQEDNELDFYGDKKRKQEINYFKTKIEHLNSELYSINNEIKYLKQTQKSSETQLQKINSTSESIWGIVILALLLSIFQCSNNNKMNDKISDIHDDISSLQHKIQ